MLRKCIFLSLFLAGYLFAMEESSSEPDILMFIGNPGVGKSSIINALKGEQVAASRVTLGHGLTQFFMPYEYFYQQQRFFLYDTPGLADITLRQRAAEEIEKALK